MEHLDEVFNINRIKFIPGYVKRASTSLGFQLLNILLKQSMKNAY